jgi:nucleoside-diphosphate-sugar epimerase
MNILITGGAGFIGSHLALAAKQGGHRVHIVDNFDAYYDPGIKRRTARMLSKEGILVHELDLSMDPLSGILEGIDFVIHAAAQPGNSAGTSYESYIRNNLHATVALVEALAGTNIGMVHVSTSSVYGFKACGDENTLPQPASAYGVSKLAGEQAVLSAVRQGRLLACSLRYFSVFGERERPDKLIPMLYSALKKDTEFPLYEGSLSHERSYTYVGDIVNGTMLALQKLPQVRGEIFNLGNDKTNTTAEALEFAQQISGKKLKVKKLPPRPGDQLATHANITKARAVLGFAPQYTLRESMKKTWEWAKNEL